MAVGVCSNIVVRHVLESIYRPVLHAVEGSFFVYGVERAEDSFTVNESLMSISTGSRALVTRLEGGVTRYRLKRKRPWRPGVARQVNFASAGDHVDERLNLQTCSTLKDTMLPPPSMATFGMAPPQIVLREICVGTSPSQFRTSAIGMSTVPWTKRA